jgi:hypothetical protein
LNCSSTGGSNYTGGVLGDVLTCEVAHAPPLAYVTVRGPLDPHTAPLLRQCVLKALTAEPVPDTAKAEMHRRTAEPGSGQ